jgi:murein DD-endopeptidase MepM/ murein hydrolase activator NlpD
MFRKISIIVGIALSTLFSHAQPSEGVESALLLMADTSSWSNAAEFLKPKKTKFNPSVDLTQIELNLHGVADSLLKIPSYSRYLNWDTQNIWHKRRNVNFTNDSAVHFTLINDSCDFVFPLAKGHQTSPFGPRWGRLHAGLDLDLETGDPVSSAFEGLVRISQFSDSYGNVVVVRHPNGLETLYAHMSARMVVSGQYVQAGDLLGLGGNTGHSFGAHLHFETRFLGNPFDPAYLIIPNKKSLKSKTFDLTHENLYTPTKAPVSPQAKTVKPKKESRETKTNGNSKKNSEKKYYTVKKGDSLTTIASKNKTTVSKICKLNGIKPSSKLKAGQKLRVK